MVTPDSNQLHQYHYDSASRVALATQETALNLDDDQLSEDEYGLLEPRSNWPTLRWRRNPDADQGRYGKLFIHDKVSPAEFIAGLLKSSPQQGNWFHDFNNLPEGAHYEPYQHDNGNWSNRLIKSTSQRAMASLLHHEAMAGQVDLIYMDPPYNISFRSNFQGMIDDTNTGERWQDIPMDVRQVKAFRDNYKDGVNSYLDQLRVQLIHGRELLKDTGSFVMQIGADNLHYVAVLMSEVFGHENHVATIPYTTGFNYSTAMLPEIGNWLIWFAKDKPEAQKKYRQLFVENDRAATIAAMNQFYLRYETEDGHSHQLTEEQRANPDAHLPGNARVYDIQQLVSGGEDTNGRSDPYIDLQGDSWPCPSGAHWRVSLDGLRHIEETNRMAKGAGGALYWKRYEHEIAGTHLSALWNAASRVRNRRYIVETPPIILERVLLMTTDPGDLVLDLTCGSGAMPLQAERWGRRWIAIDSSAVSTAIARERIATAIHPYHMLQDAPEGHRREHELAQQLLPPDRRTQYQPKTNYRHDPAQGFVLARQLRVSAATLAYGFTPADVIKHADRPEPDNSKRRVSSAFTVESDLPFSAVQPNAPHNGTYQANDHDVGIFETLRNIENALLTSGIQLPGTAGNPKKTYRVSDLEPTVEIPDVTHAGRLTDDSGTTHDAVFYICREDEVAGPFQTRNAAVAARNRRTPYACIVGFGHEGDTGSMERHQGNVTILQIMANRDLMIPGLQHQQSDNAFVVISEPDLAIHDELNGQVSIEVRGLTTYNPATGQVEPTGDRRIAGLMTDTAYDQESFKVCLLNLPQQGQISERRLQQIRDAFGSEIDDVKWQRMRSTHTLPFDRPTKGGKVAVKVIDQTGVEHMKVLDIH